MSTPAAAGAVKGEVTVVEPSRGQLALARRVAEARAIVPDHTVAVQVDAGVVAGDVPFGAWAVWAAARTLRAFPQVNGAYKDAAFERYARVNVGWVVAGADGGLVAPVVMDADTKDAAAIAAELADLSARAADGSITAPSLRGATFTVSALPVRRVTPVVLSGQAGHLGVGAVEQRAVVRDGAVVARPVADVVLAADHRIVDGPLAAAFLTTLRDTLERPQDAVDVTGAPGAR